MHRTTIFIPDDLHYRLRNLGFQTGSSISLLLELAAQEALGPLLTDAPPPEALAAWGNMLRQRRRDRDKRFRWNRS